MPNKNVLRGSLSSILMKKAIKDKFSGTKKFVRKVLSKPSASSPESTSQILNLEEQMEQEILLKNELDALKDQISNLKAAIQTLQTETEQKDISIANIAREKEKITLDLLKTRRSNVSLAKQLEDERTFYFKEKELYCHEMNECRKLKRFLSNSSIAQSEKTIEECRSEILKLKQTLNQTLEANYNLSIKFLRMKNTKTCLKTELQTMRLEHEKLVNDYKIKIENLTVELNDLVNEKLIAPISPSSKKYLQLVKQNGCLVYENLCLQLEVDNLNFKLEKLKLYQTKSTTNEHLKYIHHQAQASKDQQKSFRKAPVQNETPEKLEKEPKPCCSKSQVDESQVFKIFERKETAGIPDIEIIKERKMKSKKSEKKKKEVTKKSEDKSTSTSTNCQSDVKGPVPDYKIHVDDSYKKKIASNSSKITLFHVSNVTSSTSGVSNYVLAPSIKRTYSSPEILESVDFQKKS